jgi:putative ABC transport system permease protein
LALALAAVGLFSVVAFTIGQRMHEFGIRTALGARPSDLLRLTIVRGVAPAVLGIVVGVALALVGGRFVGGLLFNVSPRDPWVLGGASGVLFACAVAASIVPAMRASRVDPTIALRAE